MNKVFTTSLLLSSVFFATVNAEAANLTKIIIDDFDTEEQTVTVTGPVAPSVEFPIQTDDNTSNFSDSILGGYRNIFVEMTFDAFGRQSVAQVSPSVITGNGTFSISNADGVEARTVATWDGDNTSLNDNLLDSGSDRNAFALDILSIDLDANLELTVMGNNGKTATSSQTGLFPNTTAIFDFEDFVAPDSTYTEIFSDVKSIALEITGPRAFDASFDRFDVVQTGVPEPTSVLSLLGIIGFGVAINRQKK